MREGVGKRSEMSSQQGSMNATPANNSPAALSDNGAMQITYLERLEIIDENCRRRRTSKVKKGSNQCTAVPSR
jgi:hypothetical protein